jgi:5'-phosphate synthase pdxT subunit
MTKQIPTPVSWKLAKESSSSERSSSRQARTITIGVLALQGDFLEHIQTLQRLGIKTQEVRLPKDLETIDGLIMPGGESTTMANLLDVFKLREPLIQKITQGMPVWGTCAGMILLASKLQQDRPAPLCLMDIEVNRNAFGRQLESFSENLTIKQLGTNPLHATFIRAPIITRAGSHVAVLAKLSDGRIVAAQQNNMLATAFHPELTEDTRLHEYFINLVKHSFSS